MTKVMVFNFKTMQYEEATEEEGKELISLINFMNADSAASLIEEKEVDAKAEIHTKGDKK